MTAQCTIVWFISCGTLMQLLTALLGQLHQSALCAASGRREREITAKMFSGPQRKRGRVFYWQSHCYYSQMVRGVCEWVKQARSKIKQEWKKQKHTHCERSGWCNECVEIKVKQADTDSVLYSSGEQNSFQPDGGSHWPGYTEDTVHHLSFLTKVCVCLAARFFSTAYL